MKNLITLFIGLVFLCFWPGYLRKKIAGNNLLFILYLLSVSFKIV